MCCNHLVVKGSYYKKKERFPAGFSLGDSCDLQAARFCLKEVDRAGDESGCGQILESSVFLLCEQTLLRL